MTKSNMNNLVVISFDLDNALYYNEPVLANAESISAAFLQEQFDLQGREYQFDNFLQIRQCLLASKNIQYENLSYFRQTALRQFCSGLENAEKIAEKAFELFIEARSLAIIPAPVVSMLDSLSQRFILVSVTNGNCEMSRLPIASHFSKNYSTTQNYRAKPHPEMLLQVLQDFNIEASQVLHVGDSIEKDAGAAKNAGVNFYHFAPFIEPIDIEHQCLLLLEHLKINPVKSNI